MMDSAVGGRAATQRVVSALTASELLHASLKKLFPALPSLENTHKAAFKKYFAMEATVDSKAWTATRANFKATLRGLELKAERPASLGLAPEEYDWTTCWVVAQLVLMLAASKKRAARAMDFALDIMVDFDADRTISTSLAPYVRRAQEVASRRGQTTVLGVGLINRQHCQEEPRIDFDHWFAMVIAPEGIRLYMAWAGQYSILQWLYGTGGDIISAKDVETFLKAFGVLEKDQDMWTDELNIAYQTCFDINIEDLGMHGKWGDPQQERGRWYAAYQPRVKIFRLKNVRVGDILKFKWELDV